LVAVYVNYRSKRQTVHQTGYLYQMARRADDGGEGWPITSSTPAKNLYLLPLGTAVT
jgi:hypothetical protein